MCPTNFKTLFLLKDKQLNPRPDSNPEPPWVGFSILQATERLVGGRARPFIEFLCETFLRTVTTSTVDGETAGLLLPYSILVLARLPTSLSVVWRTERLFGSRARPFIEFFLKKPSCILSVTTISVESGSFCRYRGTDYVQQKNQRNQTIKPPGELYGLVPLFLL